MVLLGTSVASYLPMVAENNCVALSRRYESSDDRIISLSEKKKDDVDLGCAPFYLYVGFTVLVLFLGIIQAKIWWDIKKLKNKFKKYEQLKKQKNEKPVMDFNMFVSVACNYGYIYENYPELLKNGTLKSFSIENLVDNEEEILLQVKYAHYYDTAKRAKRIPCSLEDFRKILDGISNIDDYYFTNLRLVGRERLFIEKIFGDSESIDKNWKMNCKNCGLFKEGGDIFIGDSDLRKGGYVHARFVLDDFKCNTYINLVRNEDLALRNEMLDKKIVDEEAVGKLFKEYLHLLLEANLYAKEVCVNFGEYCLKQDPKYFNINDEELKKVREFVRGFLEERKKCKEIYDGMDDIGTFGEIFN